MSVAHLSLIFHDMFNSMPALVIVICIISNKLYPRSSGVSFDYGHMCTRRDLVWLGPNLIHFYLVLLSASMTQDSQATTTVFFQEACLSHRFIRSRDTSAIVERPQRLKAVKAGVAAAIARLEEIRGKNSDTVAQGAPDPDDVLASALERLKISDGRAATVNVAMSTVSVDLLSHPAVKYVHGDIDGDVYLERLVTLIRESEEKVARGESEIPDGLSQGDLYREFTVHCIVHYL